MSWLDTVEVDDGIETPTWTIVVPGDRLWSIRTIFTVAARDTGGTPSRSYLLTVATSTGIVAAVAATDAGTEPGTETITFANAPSSIVAVGGDAVAVAPMVLPTLYPGYTITCDIVNAVGADRWTSARVWYDYVLSGNA